MVNVPPYDSRQSNPFMKNSKKFYKHPNNKSGGRHYFHHSELTTDPTLHTSIGENSVNSVAAPAIAIVAPTARNPSIHSHGIHSSIGSSCKASSAISPQMTSAPPPRTMHVQHHIHHIQPVQLSTTLSPPPGTNTSAGVQIAAAPQQVANSHWPVVEPAFHFGSGFEIHQTYCPTHSQNDQHLVLFHIMPGVAVSFQIAGGHKIIQGESFHAYIQSLPHARKKCSITGFVAATKCAFYRLSINQSNVFVNEKVIDYLVPIHRSNLIKMFHDIVVLVLSG